jgi:hypothetical protein
MTKSEKYRITNYLECLVVSYGRTGYACTHAEIKRVAALLGMSVGDALRMRRPTQRRSVWDTLREQGLRELHSH